MESKNLLKSGWGDERYLKAAQDSKSIDRSVRRSIHESLKYAGRREQSMAPIKAHIESNAEIRPQLSGLTRKFLNQAAEARTGNLFARGLLSQQNLRRMNLFARKDLQNDRGVSAVSEKRRAHAPQGYSEGGMINSVQYLESRSTCPEKREALHSRR